jgi:hypothetical protein
VFAEVVVPKILFQLCSGPMTPTQHLETQQALVKQFAEILEFVLKFDEYKVSAGELEVLVLTVSQFGVLLEFTWNIFIPVSFWTKLKGS